MPELEEELKGVGYRKGKYILRVKGRACAAHRLEGLPQGHKCVQIHGHQFDLLVEIESRVKNKIGMVIDFGLVKKILKDLDHTHLNNILPFNPTSENIAEHIASKVADICKMWDLIRVTVGETADCSVTYEIRR